ATAETAENAESSPYFSLRSLRALRLLSAPSVVLVARLPGIELAFPEHEHASRARDEADDVGGEGDAAAAVGGRGHRDGAGAEQLHQEPEPEEGNRGKLHDLDEDPRNQRQHARVR